MKKKKLSKSINAIYTSPPNELAELENKSIVITGETLLDPAYLAYVFTLASSIKTKVMVNKVDFLHLQCINGGYRPDDLGVAGIDEDCKYQDESVEENTLTDLPTDIGWGYTKDGVVQCVASKNTCITRMKADRERTPGRKYQLIYAPDLVVGEEYNPIKEAIRPIVREMLKMI